MIAATYNFTIRRGITWGGFAIYCKDDGGEIVPLAGFKAHAQVRKTPNDPVAFSLAPVIAADDVAGRINIPQLTAAATYDLLPGGWYYDVVLETPSGDFLDPILGGKITIPTPITQPGA